MTAVAAPPAALTDRRLAAFCSRTGPEVFASVVHQNNVWTPDPLDVADVHAEARDAFERLLNRAAADTPPKFGKLLLLLGESGSGKTHLMRAFRNRTHAAGGYCGYLQLTAQASNYARYVLGNLIDALNQPYRVPEIQETGLARLALGLLESVPDLTAEDQAQFRDGYVPELAKRVFEYADWVMTDGRFDPELLDLVRALLFLLRNDHRVTARAFKWLRCEDLTSYDRDLIGGMVPRARDEDPLRMIAQLGRLADAVQGAPLVLCVDQLEDTLRHDGAGERFQQVIGTMVAIVGAVPRAVAVVACLEDYYTASRHHLSKPHLDRLEFDPEPVRLTSQRTTDEVEAIVGRRLQFLYDELGVPDDGAAVTFPFTREHLRHLSGQRTRDVLEFCRRHQGKCAAAGRWVEPGEQPPPEKAENSIELEQAWNDFHTGFSGAVPDEEDELAELLAFAVRACSDEMPAGTFFGAEADGRFVPVEVHGPGNGVDRLLVGVCNKGAQGGGLGKQVRELADRAGETPVVIVRSTAFPSSQGAAVVKQIVALIEPKGRGRRVVVENADWRRLLAFRRFKEDRGKEAGFADWQRQGQPLSQLPSLRHILALDRLTSREAPPPPPAQPAAPVSPSAPASPSPPALAESGPLLLGERGGVRSEPVTLDPDDLKHHAAFLGATGSGKTTVALNVIEQLLLRGVPAILLDRKGDLCRYADPAAWARPLDAEADARRRRLRERLEVALYTPGKADGRPLTLPVVPDGLAELPTAEREQLCGYAAASLGSMMGYKATNSDRIRLTILSKAIDVLAGAGAAVTVAALERLVKDRDDALLCAVGGYDDRHYKGLAEDLLTLKLREGQFLGGGGERLAVDALLGRGGHARPGKVRLSVISTRFLGEAGRVDFWVAQFLVALGRWIGKAPSPALQAVVLLDEADQYLPAVRQPATKAPLEHLLRRARSAGLGVFLATQSPGDLDYKGRDNIRTWLVGRVRESTALAKLKPLFAESPVDPAARLPNQDTGEFHLLQERQCVPLKARPSLIAAEQVSDERIADLARQR